MHVFWKQLILLAVVAGIATACRFDHGSGDVVVNGGFPVAYVKRSFEAVGNPIDSITFAEGGDLYVRDVASPDATPVNITGGLTQGAGDVADPAVSFDGKRLLFAMRCTAESHWRCASDTTWNVWEYDAVTGSLTRVIKDDHIANLGDDIDPAYLPDGRIVFASTRQQSTRERLGYVYLDAFRKEPVTVLHVMGPEGGHIEQLSYNQSHDRNPSVLADGRIAFARWDRVADRSEQSIYTLRPDGTEFSLLYGAHSRGESFLDPQPLPDGRLISTVLPLQGTWSGGALMTLDVARYADEDDPAPGVSPPDAGQKPSTLHPIPLTDAVSEFGRYATPHPLWDGTRRVLVSYSPFRPDTVIDPVNGEEVPAEAPPIYGIYELNLDSRSLKPLVLPDPGYAYLQPVALAPRPLPELLPLRAPKDSGLFVDRENTGILHVRSVYDTDRLGRMGNNVLTTVERAAMGIPQIAPNQPDTRAFVADIAKLKDPAQTTAAQRPARFVRVTEAIPSPADLKPEVVGETAFDMQRIVGYAPVEPDGSVMVRVPANTPLAVTVLDARGRAFETHTNFFQVRPGETLTCAGCHSPRRVEALNQAPIAGSHPNTQLISPATGRTVPAAADETMAETRLRADEQSIEAQPDLIYEDVWTDPQAAGRPRDPSLRITYGELRTPVPGNGIINYDEHIQPLWSVSRPGTAANGAATDFRCTGCHDGQLDPTVNPTALDLTGNPQGATGRTVSYEELLKGELVFNDEGRPFFDIVDGVPVLRRTEPLVQPGSARHSHLTEILYGEELFADAALTVGGVDHAAMMTEAERRLVSEWIDIGAQYVNDPYDSNGDLIQVAPRLSYRLFLSNVWSVLKNRCAICHRPALINGNLNPYFEPTQFILTGDPAEDFRAAAGMVSDVTNPQVNPLLERPTSIITHPEVGGRPVLDAGVRLERQDIEYIEVWIRNAQ